MNKLPSKFLKRCICCGSGFFSKTGNNNYCVNCKEMSILNARHTQERNVLFQSLRKKQKNKLMESAKFPYNFYKKTRLNREPSNYYLVD